MKRWRFCIWLDDLPYNSQLSYRENSLVSVRKICKGLPGLAGLFNPQQANRGSVELHIGRTLDNITVTVEIQLFLPRYTGERDSKADSTRK